MRAGTVYQHRHMWACAGSFMLPMAPYSESPPPPAHPRHRHPRPGKTKVGSSPEASSALTVVLKNPSVGLHIANKSSMEWRRANSCTQLWKKMARAATGMAMSAWLKLAHDTHCESEPHGPRHANPTARHNLCILPDSEKKGPDAPHHVDRLTAGHARARALSARVHGVCTCQHNRRLLQTTC